jgi:hypothetical protein
MNRSLRRSLALEKLESKAMLAGDVVVNVVEGNLIIQGDELGNQIAVSSGDAAGTYLIRGLDGTTVKLGEDGEPAPETGLVVEGVRRHVRISLGDGDDSVTVADARFRHGLSIATGAGADSVSIGASDETPAPALGAAATDANVSVRGSLLVRTGADNDTVNVGSAHVGGLLGISTDGGDDTVQLGGEAPSPEGLAATDVALASSATLRAVLGVDVLLGEGDDDAVLRDVAALHVGVGAGAGADEVGLVGVRSLFVGVRGGDGDGADVVSLNDVHSHLASVGTGEGADRVNVTSSKFGVLTALLGGSNDLLTLQNVEARLGLLAGGEGDADELSDGGTNTFTRKVVTGFEIPPDVNTPPLRSRPLARLAGLFRR